MTTTSYLLLDWQTGPLFADGSSLVSGPFLTGIFDSAEAAFAVGSRRARVIEVTEVIRDTIIQAEPTP